MTDYATIGALLRAARERSGWSQEHVARRLGVTGANISLVEQGKTQPPLPALAAHAAAVGLVLDVAVFSATDGSAELLHKLATVLPRLSPTARKTLEAWTALGDEITSEVDRTA